MMDRMRDVWQNPVTGQWDEKSPTNDWVWRLPDAIDKALVEMSLGDYERARKTLYDARNHD